MSCHVTLLMTSSLIGHVLSSQGHGVVSSQGHVQVAERSHDESHIGSYDRFPQSHDLEVTDL